MSLPTPYWTEGIKITPYVRLALVAGQDVSVLGEDGTVLAVLVHPDRYSQLNGDPEYG